MIKRKIKLTVPQYRERKEIFDALGYKEVSLVEKDLYCFVTQEIDESDPKYPTMRRFEKNLYRKGPTFLPIIILVFIAFTLLSCFAIFLAAEKDKFDLVSNALYFLLPAFMFLGADVIYISHNESEAKPCFFKSQKFLMHFLLQNYCKHIP